MPEAEKKPYPMDLEAGDHWWCSCGHSQTPTLCDGAHKGSGMIPKKFTLTEPRQVWLCGCGQSADAPFCDGTHTRL